jgi:hypothetical protein
MQTFSSALVRLQRLPAPAAHACVLLALLLGLVAPTLHAAAPKVHTVSLGAARKVPYTPAEATVESKADDSMTLKVRPLIVDGRQKEWTTGDIHEVTDRSFTVRRVIRLNDALPSEPGARWVWQPGAWLLVDRATGHITALHLPDFDAEVSEVSWYRDYAAYCGIAQTAKGGLFAVVAQLGARRVIAQKELAKWPMPEHPKPVCTTAQWARQPLRVTLGMTGGPPMTFTVVGTTSLVEEGDSGDDQ